MKKVMLSALLLSLPLLGYAQERFPLPEAAASAFATAVAGKTKRSLPRYWAMTGGNFCRRKVPIPRPWPASIVTGAKAIALYKRQYGAPECRARRLAAPGAHGERDWRLAL